ncbi:mRNA export factor GLE1 isoform X1 [Nicotiana tomentosiformis]|uniref:mRNA export factor GLE1 isoform X1 n=1 Tax=Nicotiana tomentosiformis TaxID=4098 RepID=UPI00051CA4A6|nr:protein GLE1 isoform X1 [Nicotiana tomentosiformis]XP_033508295.1 protein GLE1 isoform X1 [Nicotiana tomentosiformis]XP_033508296.1 protein GLE1 isoform X1 [Nicotiana tomentosiformis]
MGAVKLQLPLPKNVDGVTLDPNPDWSFDALLVELNSIEKKLNGSSKFPIPFTKAESRELLASKNNSRRGFIMQVSDDDMEDLERDTKDEVGDHFVMGGKRFACDEIYLSDSDHSEEGLGIELQHDLMDKVGLVKSALSELAHEHQLTIAEEMRDQLSSLEAELMDENEKLASTLERVERNIEAQREMNRKFDMQYQRKIAEALDDHLTAVQRDHEHRSQIEERRIRDDAAREEAKRKEKALHEEKARQEMIRAEAKVQARLEAERVEKEKAAALEAERKVAKETAAAVEKKASESLMNAPSEANKVLKEVTSHKHSVAGNTIRVSENAQKLEEKRLKIYNEIASQNEALGSCSNKAYRKYEMEIARRIRTITGTKENVRVKADELIKLISDSTCPQSISIAMFAQKVVSLCVNPTGSFNSAVYAYGRVIVLVTSKVPLTMDVLIGELNKVCIYAVPKYIIYSEAAFQTKEAYYKAIGYAEEDGKIESTDSYVDRLSAYMKLYGALVQTEVEGCQNLHGLREGWAWIARFLNVLPANLYTAAALQAFLEMAGFALHKRYKTQFRKMLDIIAKDFLTALKDRGDAKLNKVIVNIRNYIESNQFLKEPEGWRLRSNLESHNFTPESDHQQQYGYQQNRYYR